MIRKSTLAALICALGLTHAPEAHPMEKAAKVGFGLLATWQLISLYRTHYRVPKADRKKRPFADTSKELYKQDPVQWRKNIWHNLVVFQEDWVEGQAFKDTYFKRKGEDHYGCSKRKCLPFGWNGMLLVHLYTMNKTAKSVGELAFYSFAFSATLSILAGKSPKVPDCIKNNEVFQLLFKNLGWQEEPVSGNTAPGGQ